MAKFHLGQMVKYVGREGFRSPPVGTVGTVLKINYWGTNFLVKFPKGSIVSLDSFPNNTHYWYSEDELEPTNDQDMIKKVKVRCIKRNWEWTKV
jgi:hypothetical protein